MQPEAHLLVMQQNAETEARGRTVALYIGGAFLFGLGIWATAGPTKAEEFLAGYLLEQSLSIDNLFVFILVFNYFKTPVDSQPKVRHYTRRTVPLYLITPDIFYIICAHSYQHVCEFGRANIVPSYDSSGRE